MRHGIQRVVGREGKRAFASSPSQFWSKWIPNLRACPQRGAGRPSVVDGMFTEGTSPCRVGVLSVTSDRGRLRRYGLPRGLEKSGSYLTG